MYSTDTVWASDVVRNSLTTLWGAVAAFLPKLIAAIVVFLIGWLVAVIISRLAFYIIKVLRLDEALERVGFRTVWERSGFELDSAHFFGELVKWFFIVVFLMSATDILGLSQVSDFLNEVVIYIPNVIVAALVLLIGILVARFLEGLVVASLRAAKLASANFLGHLTRWAIVIFSLLVALSQLGVAEEIFQVVIVGVGGAAALGLGLAFGLGGQKHADDFMSGLKKRIRD